MTAVAVERDLANPERREEAASPAPTPNPSRRILVVEDNEDTRQSFQQLLEIALGVEVDLARDGNQALAILLERPYSIMITDLRMPKLDGMKLLEEIQTRRLPVTVIVTTGHGSIDEAVQAMRMGAYDFLTKPPDPQHLCLLVERLARTDLAGRAGRPPDPDRRAARVLEHPQQVSADVRHLRSHRARRGDHDHRLDRGRNGDGEGAGRAGDPSIVGHTPFRAVRRRPLRGAAGDAPGERAVRAREGVRSPARPASARGGSSWPTGGPCSSTRSATSPCRCR